MELVTRQAEVQWQDQDETDPEVSKGPGYDQKGHAHGAKLSHLGIVTGCSTRPGTAAGYSRVRVWVGFLQPGPYPYPQPGVGGSAHTFKLRAKSTQTTPDASFGLYVGTFSFLFFRVFPN